jgi:hypothetical protein
MCMKGNRCSGRCRNHQAGLLLTCPFKNVVSSFMYSSFSTTSSLGFFCIFLKIYVETTKSNRDDAKRRAGTDEEIIVNLYVLHVCANQPFAATTNLLRSCFKSEDTARILILILLCGWLLRHRPSLERRNDKIKHQETETYHLLGHPRNPQGWVSDLFVCPPLLDPKVLALRANCFTFARLLLFNFFVAH